MSVSPFPREVRARAKAYSFLYFEHIAQGLAVGGCLSHITEQIERMSGKGRMPSCVGLDKHVQQLPRGCCVLDFIGCAEMMRGNGSVQCMSAVAKTVPAAVASGLQVR